MNTWIHYEREDNWHLVTDSEIYGVEEDDMEIFYRTWCGMTLDGKAKRKEQDEIDQWADILHDDCYRKSQE